MNNTKRQHTRKLVGIAVFAAIVIVLQLLGAFIRLGQFSVSLVLIPIVVGSAVYGMGAGTWLGLIFGIAVLLSGDAATFLAISPIGTVITVLLKGTGVFLIGCKLFFWETIKEWSAASEYGADVVKYVLFILVGGNFIFEFIVNLVMSPAVVRIVDIGKARFGRNK